MDTAFLQGLDKVMCAGYLLAVSCINLNLYLISAFYRKKFNQLSPRAGFIVSIALAILFISSFFFSGPDQSSGWGHLRIARLFFLVGSAVACGWSSAALYIAMRKPRK
jgi:uncharacterized membrane protein